MRAVYEDMYIRLGSYSGTPQTPAGVPESFILQYKLANWDGREREPCSRRLHALQSWTGIQLFQVQCLLARCATEDFSQLADTVKVG
jgi:hypothetical protein